MKKNLLDYIEPNGTEQFKRLKESRKIMLDTISTRQEKQTATWNFYKANVGLLRSDNELKVLWRKLFKDNSEDFCASFFEFIDSNKNEQQTNPLVYDYIFRERSYFSESCAQ